MEIVVLVGTGIGIFGLIKLLVLAERRRVDGRRR